MAAPALADALRDFGAIPAVLQRGDHLRPAPTLHDAVQSAPPPPPVPDPEIIRAEVEKAEAALRERLEQQHEAAISLLGLEHKAALEAQQLQLAASFAEALSTRLDEAEARLVDLTTQVASRILGALLSDDVRKKVVVDLAVSIREALGDREAVRIRAHGPASLYEALVAALPRHADRIDFTETAAVDLTVAIDDALFETRIAEWSAALSEALPG